MVPPSWVKTFRYDLLSPPSSYESLFYTCGQKVPSKRWYLTAKWIVSLLTSPRPRQLYLTRKLATSRKYSSGDDEKRKCFYNCVYILETWWTKEMFLQVSLSSGDLIEKGNVLTTVFTFWRLDGGWGKCFYTRLYRLETWWSKEIFLQLSLYSGDWTKAGNIFATVSIYWIWDKKCKYLYSPLNSTATICNIKKSLFHAQNSCLTFLPSYNK